MIGSERRVLVRTWNIFHGNASPPERHAFLEEMIRLAARDRPGLLCLQELPLWSLIHLSPWSGMTAIGDTARRSPLGSSAPAREVERLVTDLHHGVLRSALTGQGNAVLLADDMRVLDHRCIVLNPRSFRRTEAQRLGLTRELRWRWAKERRVCQVLRLARADTTFVAANLHASGGANGRFAEAELMRAATYLDGFASPGEPVVLAGDFNVTVGGSRALATLTSAEWSFSGATPAGIDHVLVRSAEGGAPEVWLPARRTHGGRLLSDHAPVDREVAL